MKLMPSDGEHDRQAREEGPPPVALDELPCEAVRAVPQLMSVELTPKPRKLTKASRMMTPATMSVADDDDRAEGVGQDVPEDDAPVADAHGPGGIHEVLLAQGQEQARTSRASPARRAARR